MGLRAAMPTALGKLLLAGAEGVPYHRPKNVEHGGGLEDGSEAASLLQHEAAHCGQGGTGLPRSPSEVK